MASEDVARVHGEAIIVEGHRDMFEIVGTDHVGLGLEVVLKPRERMIGSLGVPVPASAGAK